MAVNKIKDGTWEAKISYRADGKVKSHQKRFSTRREAKDYEADFLRKRNFYINEHTLYDDIFESYISKSSQNANDRTIKSKRFIAKKFWPDFFGKKMAKISKKNYLDVWIKISDSDYSVSRKNKMIHILKAISLFAYQYYDLPDNAKTLTTIKPNSDEEREMQIIDEVQLELLLENIDDEVSKRLLWFLFYTGLRVGEARALQKDDLRDNKIVVSKSIRSFKQGFTPLKTANSKRIVTVDETTLDMIKPLMEIEGQFIFGGLEPIGMSTVQRSFENARDKTEIPRIRIHDLRHSHASLLINRGANIVAVSKRLGHSNIQTTLRTYTHLMQESDDKIMEILNKKNVK